MGSAYRETSIWGGLMVVSATQELEAPIRCAVSAVHTRLRCCKGPSTSPSSDRSLPVSVSRLPASALQIPQSTTHCLPQAERGTSPPPWFPLSFLHVTEYQRNYRDLLVPGEQQVLKTGMLSLLMSILPLNSVTCLCHLLKVAP